MELLTERYSDRIAGVLSCYDRIIIQSTFPGVCFAEGMKVFPWRVPPRERLHTTTTLTYRVGGLEILKKL